MKLWVHNVLVTPFLPVRIVLFVVARIGDLAGRLLNHMPGWHVWWR